MPAPIEGNVYFEGSLWGALINAHRVGAYVLVALSVPAAADVLLRFFRRAGGANGDEAEDDVHPRVVKGLANLHHLLLVPHILFGLAAASVRLLRRGFAYGRWATGFGLPLYLHFVPLINIVVDALAMHAVQSTWSQRPPSSRERWVRSVTSVMSGASFYLNMLVVPSCFFIFVWPYDRDVAFLLVFVFLVPLQASRYAR